MGLLLLISALLQACAGKGDAAKATNTQGAPAMPVEVIRAEPRTLPLYGEFVGTIQSRDTVEITSRIDGYIEKKLFDTGQDVKVGQLLYQIDARGYDAELQRARAEVARAEAELNFAKEGVQLLQSQAQLAQSQATLIKADQDVARIQPLAREQAVPEQDLDQAVATQRATQAEVKARQAAVDQQRLTQRTQIDQAAASLASAKAALRQAELNMGWTEIRSPVAGRMGESNARVGTLASRNATQPLALLSPLDPISVVFKVAERDYLSYKKQQEAMRAGKGGVDPAVNQFQLLLADGSVYPHPGRYRTAERAIDEKTGTLELTADFPNPQRVLLPGQFARVRVQNGLKEGAFVVPQRAVQELQGVRSVLVVDANNKVIARTVNATNRLGSLWIIESGLTEGDRVIVEGGQKVRPGAQVQPKLVPMPEGANGGGK